jgi:hypothetical protein
MGCTIHKKCITVMYIYVPYIKMEKCTSSIFELVQDIDEMYMWFQFEEASSIREKVIAITRKCTTVKYIYVPYI